MNNKCSFTKNVICEYMETDDKMEYPCHDCINYKDETLLDPPQHEGFILPAFTIIAIAGVILGLLWLGGQVFGK